MDRFPRIRMLNEPKRRIRFLTRQEADHLIGCLPDHMRPVVRYALATGCRMGEILSLEWSRADFERHVAWLDPGTTKNGEGRGIPLNREALLALRSVEGRDERWCFTFEGRRMETSDRPGNALWRGLGLRTFAFTTCGTPGPAGT